MTLFFVDTLHPIGYLLLLKNVRKDAQIRAAVSRCKVLSQGDANKRTVF